MEEWSLYNPLKGSKEWSSSGGHWFLELLPFKNNYLGKMWGKEKRSKLSTSSSSWWSPENNPQPKWIWKVVWQYKYCENTFKGLVFLLCVYSHHLHYRNSSSEGTKSTKAVWQCDQQDCGEKGGNVETSGFGHCWLVGFLVWLYFFKGYSMLEVVI